MKRAAVIAHIEAVFAEEGSHGEHFVAGFEHGVEEGVHHAGRAAAEHDVLGFKGGFLLAAQPGGQFFARPGEAALGM